MAVIISNNFVLSSGTALLSSIDANWRTYRTASATLRATTSGVASDQQGVSGSSAYGTGARPSANESYKINFQSFGAGAAAIRLRTSGAFGGSDWTCYSAILFQQTTDSPKRVELQRRVNNVSVTLATFNYSQAVATGSMEFRAINNRLQIFLNDGSEPVIDYVDTAPNAILSAGFPVIETSTAQGLGYNILSFTVDDLAELDITAPVLSSGVATPQSSGVVSVSVSTNEAGGTLYALATQSGVPSVGAIKASSLSSEVLTSGVQTVELIGLEASTSYSVHLLHSDAAGNDSAILSVGPFTTAAPPPAPTIQSTLVEALGRDVFVDFTVDGFVEIASASVGELSASASLVSTGLYRATFTNVPVGTYEVTVSASNAGGSAAENAGSVTIATIDGEPQYQPGSQPVDTTPPVLSFANGTATGPTTASGLVSTSEAGGMLFALVSENEVESSTSVKAGAQQSVSTVGLQLVTVGGLTPSTQYRIHFLHQDASGNDSAVLSSAYFTTQALPVEVEPSSPIKVRMPAAFAFKRKYSN